MTHDELMASIRAEFGRQLRLFRNEAAGAWAGKAQRMQDGGVFIPAPRFIQAGLCPGSADLIGWRKVLITPEMVGRDFAQFTAIEVKTGSGRLEGKQRAFLDAVDDQGGLAVLATSLNDVRLALGPPAQPKKAGR